MITLFFLYLCFDQVKLIILIFDKFINAKVVKHEDSNLNDHCVNLTNLY